MTPENNTLSTTELRNFGLTIGTIIALLFGLFLPWIFDYPWPIWLWVVLGILFALGVVLPDSLVHIYRVWMKFGLVMGWINTRIILGVMFYLVFFPVGLIMRLFGNDPMARKLDKSIQSYRVISATNKTDHIGKPY